MASHAISQSISNHKASLRWARALGVVTGGLALLLLIGCTAYVGAYQYMPRPMLAEVPATQPGQNPPLTVLASVIGVRRADKDQGIPESVHVRLRVENNGPGMVNFNPASLELTSGALIRFPPALTRPVQTVAVVPAQAAVFDAYFPFPAGQSYDTTDLGALQLRWQVQIAGQVVGQVVYFHRVSWRYYDPYWDAYYPYYPRPWYGGRVVIERRR